MARVAEEEFGVTGLWLEDKSLDTAQNAQFVAAMLRPKGIQRVLLVTDAHHMRRARGCFQRQGLDVICAPMESTIRSPWTRGIFAVLPSFQAFYGSSQALEEWLGLTYYGLRGY